MTEQSETNRAGIAKVAGALEEIANRSYLSGPLAREYADRTGAYMNPHRKGAAGGCVQVFVGFEVMGGSN